MRREADLIELKGITLPRLLPKVHQNHRGQLYLTEIVMANNLALYESLLCEEPRKKEHRQFEHDMIDLRGTNLFKVAHFQR